MSDKEMGNRPTPYKSLREELIEKEEIIRANKAISCNRKSSHPTYHLVPSSQSSPAPSSRNGMTYKAPASFSDRETDAEIERVE